MAQKIEILLIDDTDGGAADETVAFGYDGAIYEIDLSTANAKALRAVFDPFVTNARKAPATPRKHQGTRAVSDRERNADVRAWAKQQGITLNERGRIPATVIEQYKAAH
jgi:nucleoid-associated protein Lsr2